LKDKEKLDDSIRPETGDVEDVAPSRRHDPMNQDKHNANEGAISNVKGDKKNVDFYVIGIPDTYALIGLVIICIIIILPIYTFCVVSLMYRYTTTFIV
jgi:hypothetical protein